jgi:hypothetical protein
MDTRGSAEFFWACLAQRRGDPKWQGAADGGNHMVMDSRRRKAWRIAGWARAGGLFSSEATLNSLIQPGIG